MSQIAQQTPERAEATPASRLIPYWPDGHWETSLDTADVMDRVEAFGPIPYRTIEMAYGASNDAIDEAVKQQAGEWYHDPALPCAQGHAGSETQGQEEAVYE